jgi:ABC-type uncharacterized transport system substrate-binding protein/predicted nucleic acid-binding Zn ribbon protein
MAAAPPGRRCPVCDHPIPAGSICPHCRAHPAQRQSYRAAWMLAGGALFFLAALIFWVRQLGGPEEHAPREFAGPAGTELVPDATTRPGEPLPVAFGNEHCVPWHVSKAEPPPPAGDSYLLLTSRVADPHGLVLSGFGTECGERHPSLVLEQLKKGELRAAVDELKPRGVVVVGMAAYRLVQQEAQDLPVLYAHISNPQGAGLDGPGRAGVTPWVPFPPLVRHLLDVLPKKKPLAVFHPPGYLAEPARAAAEQIRKQGRKASVFEVSADADLEQILQRAASEAGAWIVFTDRKVIDRKLFNRIQVAAEKHAIPLGVSDEDHVRWGSLVGVGPDSHRIGRQLCHLAGALSRDRLPRGSHVFCPEYTFAVINNTVAEKLGYLYDIKSVKQAKLYTWH